MLSRRDKLLIRPWQQRRYTDHRNKVNSALPAIDVEPPAARSHILCKRKKLQKEAERCQQIAEDNFILVKHLSDIMKSHRMDNYWIKEPPTFLHKVGIYHQPKDEPICKSKAIIFEPKLNSRKEKCYACGPLRFVKKEIIPEERIPWEPNAQRLLSRKSSIIKEQPKQLNAMHCNLDLPKFRGQTWSPVPDKGKQKSKKNKNKNKGVTEKLPAANFMGPVSDSHCIELNQGPLHLAVTFPMKTTVAYKVGNSKRILHTDDCQCKAFQTFATK